MEESASAAHRAAIDRMNAGDVDSYMAFYSDDVVFGGVGPEPMDWDATKAFHEGYVAAFPDTHVEILDMFESGGRVAARIVIHGTHQGQFMGVAPTGRPAGLAITTVLTVRDGEVRRALVDPGHVRPADPTRGAPAADGLSPSTEGPENQADQGRRERRVRTHASDRGR